MQRTYDVRLVSQWSREQGGTRLGTLWIVDRLVSSWWARSIVGDLFVYPMSGRLPWGGHLLQVQLGRCVRIARAWQAHRLACWLCDLEQTCPALIVADRLEELREHRLAAELRELYGDQPRMGLRVRPELPPTPGRISEPLNGWEEDLEE